jgi:hypothetical protein
MPSLHNRVAGQNIVIAQSLYTTGAALRFINRYYAIARSSRYK